MTRQELGRLTRLREWFSDDMAISGTIPPELALCAALEVLVIEGNRLTGTAVKTPLPRADSNVESHGSGP
jgi:hypothetical protein